MKQSLDSTPKVAAISIVLLGALTLALGWFGTRVDAAPPSGREIFRFDTFGDEQLWTDVLGMHEVIPAEVDPKTALAVGLKLDVEALPPEVLALIENDDPALEDPATTVELLRLNAVVGVIGQVDEDGVLTEVGITCALCHSTVDDSFTDGVGHRLDGWPNLDLNPGLILSLSDAFDDETKADLGEWGPGMYDPRFHAFDGTNVIDLNEDSTTYRSQSSFRRSTASRACGGRPSPARDRSRTGTATSACRKWVVRATSRTIDFRFRSISIRSPIW